MVTKVLIEKDDGGKAFLLSYSRDGVVGLHKAFGSVDNAFEFSKKLTSSPLTYVRSTTHTKGYWESVS